MKETKLLAVTAILLLTSCSPKVVTHIVRTYPNPVPADSVYVIEPGDTVPNTAETLGSVSVVDRGTSRNCRYDQVLRLAQEATGKNGGNGLAITEHVKPSFWGSSCHQINALMLHLTDTKVNATEGNPVQDMIDLGRVAVREEKEKRRAPANTFEASFGYGWVTNKMYDVNVRLERRNRVEVRLRIYVEQRYGNRTAIFRFQKVFFRWRRHDAFLYSSGVGRPLEVRQMDLKIGAWNGCFPLS